MSKTIHANFVITFVSLLDLLVKKHNYDFHANHIEFLNKDIKEFETKSDYNLFISKKEEIVNTYGIKYYSNELNRLNKIINNKIKNRDKIISRLQKADKKIENAFKANFDIDKIVDSFDLVDSYEQYNEGLITFVEFANYAVTEFSKV